jgi:hypothetical protein
MGNHGYRHLGIGDGKGNRTVQATCPAGIDIPWYVRCFSEGKAGEGRHNVFQARGRTCAAEPPQIRRDAGRRGR